MKTIYLIAADSIRALLHQRLLVGLMLASLALTVVMSVMMSSVSKNISKSFSDDASTPVTISGTNQMSEADRRKFR